MDTVCEFGGGAAHEIRMVVEEFPEGLLGASWHGGEKGAFGAVPFEGHASALFGMPVDVNIATFIKGASQVFDILLTFVFDSEVIGHKNEWNVSPFVAEQTFCFRLVAAVGL